LGTAKPYTKTTALECTPTGAVVLAMLVMPPMLTVVCVKARLQVAF